MFDFLEDAFSSIGDWFSSPSDPFSPVTDYLTGYTSANQAQRFSAENLALQQQYNLENMQRQQCYNLTNMRKTDEYQRKLMADTPSIQVQALRAAGLNPLLAVGNGITSANTAVHSVNPTSSAPLPSSPSVTPQLGSLVSLASTAFGAYGQLAKLGSEVALNKANSAAANASAMRDAASAEKLAKESASIDPSIARDNARYGTTGLVGQAHKFIRSLADGFGSTGAFSDSGKTPITSADSAAQTKALQNVSSSSAEGLADAVDHIERKVLPRMLHETSKTKATKSKRRHN